MLDWKKRAEAQGRKFPNGLKDVQQDPDCNAEWQVNVYRKKASIDLILAGLIFDLPSLSWLPVLNKF